MGIRLGSATSSFRDALDKLGEGHRRMDIPTYTYALVGATILDCFQPVFEKEEEDTKGTDEPILAKDLRSALLKVYGEIMSIIYYPMLRQEKLVNEAREFYEQLKEEFGWSDSEFQRRLLEVESEISGTGTYTQTTEELEMGARLAWRNSAKCIGECLCCRSVRLGESKRCGRVLNKYLYSVSHPRVSRTHFVEYSQDKRLPPYQ